MTRVMVQADSRVTSIADLADLEARFPRSAGEGLDAYARRAWLYGLDLFKDCDDALGTPDVFVLAQDGETWVAA